MAKAIMIQGTMSNVGKSLIVAGLCRIFKQDGYKVAPFKSQNMALNSYITEENLEIGRAQAVQAEACGIRPNAAMNPILLKPTTDMGSQVIVMGKVVGNMQAVDYFKCKKDYIPIIKDAYETLAEEYDIIVIEGAGSPAEINLKQDDIVNMGLAGLLDVPVLLVGDIDRGGVFAQLVGTVMLLEEEERARIQGLIINKFRGDLRILEPGLAMLTERCGKDVLGVIPYLDVDIEEEDSLAKRLHRKSVEALIDAAVIRFPRLSNFTDVQPLEAEEGVSVRYVEYEEELGNPDFILIPGTKNTMEDLGWLKSSGLEAKILRLAEGGTVILGICGGYQILGEEIIDTCGVEKRGSVRGLGLLPVTTYFKSEKIRSRKRGTVAKLEGIFQKLSGKKAAGYEIHMGRSVIKQKGKEKAVPALKLEQEVSVGEKTAMDVGEGEDGCCCGNVFGTYLHGIFDEEEFRNAWIQMLCEKKGITLERRDALSYQEYKEMQYDKLAAALRESLDMETVYRILGKNQGDGNQGIWRESKSNE